MLAVMRSCICFQVAYAHGGISYGQESLAVLTLTFCIDGYAYNEGESGKDSEGRRVYLYEDDTRVAVIGELDPVPAGARRGLNEGKREVRGEAMTVN